MKIPLNFFVLVTYKERKFYSPIKIKLKEVVMSNATSSRGGHKPSSYVTNFSTISFEGSCLRENKALDKISKKAFSKGKGKKPILVKKENRPDRRFIQKTQNQNQNEPKINYKTLKGMLKKATPENIEMLKGYGYTVTPLSREQVLKSPCFKTMFNCNGHPVRVTPPETI